MWSQACEEGEVNALQLTAFWKAAVGCQSLWDEGVLGGEVGTKL